MSREHDPASNPDGLTHQQAIILEGFSQAYKPNPRTTQETAAYDQSIASMRENITEGFGLELNTPSEFYSVMAGLCAATDKMERLIGMGVAPDMAAKVLRHSLAGLMPESGDPTIPGDQR